MFKAVHDSEAQFPSIGLSPLGFSRSCVFDVQPDTLASKATANLRHAIFQICICKFTAQELPQ